jgi:uncharacterized protein YndB with AHSA1/START domain
MNRACGLRACRVASLVVLSSIGAAYVLAQEAMERTDGEVVAIAPIGGRLLTHSAIIRVPVEDVFASFTTAEGIVRAWGVAKARVDFRVGGEFRTAYEEETDLDSRNAIVNTILSFEPNRMISIKATAPIGSPEWLELVCAETHSVITFEPVSPLATRLTITGVGYQAGGLWDEAYAFFDKGNQWTLDHMKAQLEGEEERGDTAANAAEAMELLRSFEGDWVFETKGPDGKAFLGLTRFYGLVDGAWVGADGWLGGEEGMSPHAHWVAGVNPSTGMVEYTNYFEKGHIGTGHIEVVAPNTLGFEMMVHTAGGAEEESAREPAPQVMYVEFEKRSDDAFVSRMYMGIDRRTEGAKPMMELPYTRVASVPERYLRMKGEQKTSSVDAALAPVVARVVVAAPVDEVWRAWTTSEGLSAVLGGRTTRVECVVGGAFEIHFSDEAPEGERGSEGCRVLSYVPRRMISFTWNAPPQFAHARQRHSHVVVELRAVTDSTTEITLTNLGFDALAAKFPNHAEEYRQVRAYFAVAWPRVLGWFVEHFEKE